MLHCYSVKHGSPLANRPAGWDPAYFLQPKHMTVLSSFRCSGPDAPRLQLLDQPSCLFPQLASRKRKPLQAASPPNISHLCTFMPSSTYHYQRITLGRPPELRCVFSSSFSCRSPPRRHLASQRVKEQAVGARITGIHVRLGKSTAAQGTSGPTPPSPDAVLLTRQRRKSL